MYRSILVPVDESEHARMALEVARELLAPESAKLYLLHVADIGPSPEAPGAVSAGVPAISSGVGVTREEIDRMSERVERAEQSGLDLIEQVKRAAGLADVEARAIVRIGHPAEVIVTEAEALGVDAVVMGSRGMSRIGSLVLGSVSHKVMHTAKCRVILAH